MAAVTGCNTAGTSAEDFKTVEDYINDPVVSAAIDETPMGVCDKPGAPDITGVYRPAMRVTDCSNCTSMLGTSTPEDQRIAFCNQVGDSVQSTVTASGVYGEGHEMVVARCSSSMSEYMTLTIYGVTEGNVQGCQLTTVNVMTISYIPEFGVFYNGRQVDVIVYLGSGCADLGVTSQVGDWFYWEYDGDSFGIGTGMYRVGECPGDDRDLPLPCSSYFEMYCGSDSDCADGTSCELGGDGYTCTASGCLDCWADNKSCYETETCKFNGCAD